MERGLAETLPTRAGGRNLTGVDLAEATALAAALLSQDVAVTLGRARLGGWALRWPGHGPRRRWPTRPPYPTAGGAGAGPDGGQLLDLPDAPRPSPDVPAPPRFLPEYDNLLLSFAERSRVIPHRRPVPLPPGNGATGGTLLVDGLWQADWKITKGTLEIQPHRQLSRAEMDAIAAEGARLLDFAGPTGTGLDVRFAPVS